MLNRRELLKFGLVTAAVPSLLTRLAAEEGEPAKLIGKFDIPKDFLATSVFEPIKMSPGTVAEFPVSKSQPTAFVNYNYNQTEEIKTKDYVYVPTYDLGANGYTATESEKNLLEKIKKEAFNLLRTVGTGNTLIKRASLKKAIRKDFHIFNEKYYTMTVAKIDACVMPIRQEPLTFFDETDKIYYSWCEIGLAVLDSRCVRLAV